MAVLHHPPFPVFQSQKSCPPSCHSEFSCSSPFLLDRFNLKRAATRLATSILLTCWYSILCVSISKKLPPVLPPCTITILSTSFNMFQSQKSCHPSCHLSRCTAWNTR